MTQDQRCAKEIVRSVREQKLRPIATIFIAAQPFIVRRTLALVSRRVQSHIPDASAPHCRLARDGWQAKRSMPGNMSEAELAEVLAEIEMLRQEHRDLDAAIDALQDVGAPDQLQIQRLKKRKLVLRDRITRLEDMITPDIIA